MMVNSIAPVRLNASSYALFGFDVVPMMMMTHERLSMMHNEICGWLPIYVIVNENIIFLYK